MRAIPASFDFPGRTAVVCHDAGAANIIIAELQSTGRRDWRGFMRGPALTIWREVFPEGRLFDSMEAALEGADLLVTGTGWSSSTEHDARQLAKEKGIRSIAVVDHWVGYAERFERQGHTIHPDEIWVTDEYALEIAKSVFRNIDLSLRPNRYVERQLRAIERVKPSSPRELLYVLEPIRADWGKRTPGEIQALDYFVSCLPRLGLTADAVICLRPHPSEPHGKYDGWIASNSRLDIRLDSSLEIAGSLGRSTWVAGCESFALALALKAGRITYCTLPPWAPPCRLPHDGLVHLKHLPQPA